MSTWGRPPSEHSVRVTALDGSVVQGKPLPPRATSRRKRTPTEEQAEAVQAQAEIEQAAVPGGPLQSLLHLQSLARELTMGASKLDATLALATQLAQIAGSPEALRQVQASHQARLANEMAFASAEGEAARAAVDTALAKQAAAWHAIREAQKPAATQLVHLLLPLAAVSSGQPVDQLPVRAFVGMVTDMLAQNAQATMPR